MITSIKLIPAVEVMQRRGGGRGGRHGGHSQLYAEIADGTWPPFVKFGRASLLPEHECDAMLAAIVRGATDDLRRQLVQQLVAQRKTAFPAAESAA
jgi:hypothetical protein